MPSIYRQLIALVVLLGAVVTASAASPPPADEVFRLHIVRDGDSLNLVWSIPHNNPLSRNQRGGPGGSSPADKVALTTPAGQFKDDPNFGPQEVYHNEVTATIPWQAVNSRPRIIVTYQGCAERFQICYPPIRKVVDLRTLSVSNPAENIASTDGESALIDVPLQPADSASANSLAPSTEQSFAVGSALLSFFGFGLLLSLSPCTFPMVPIFFGLLARSNAQPTRWRGLALAGVFVAASASAYALLGAFSAWSGSGENLQVLLQTPAALSVMSAVLVAFAMSMFGVFKIQLPGFVAARISNVAFSGQRGPVTAALILGFGSALIAGPCVTPPLATALLYVARTGDVVRGMAALFVFGVGLGMPLLVFGALGPRFLPKPGPWLIRVQHAFGFIMLGLALWMMSRVLSDATVLLLSGALAWGCALYLAVAVFETEGFKRLASATVGAVALLVGSTLIFGATGDQSFHATQILERWGLLRLTPNDQPRVVRSMDELTRELATARASDKPVMVDFSADWCVECKLMDAVLREPKLQQQLEGFHLVRADVTSVDASTRSLMQSFNIVGPPTILLFESGKRSDPAARIVGFVTADALSDKLSSVK